MEERKKATVEERSFPKCKQLEMILMMMIAFIITLGEII